MTPRWRSRRSSSRSARTIWQEPWVHARPGDRRLRHEQWQTEGMPSTLAMLRRVRYAVTAHLVARLFDLEFDGRSEVLARTRSGARALARASSHTGGEAVIAHVEVPCVKEIGPSNLRRAGND